MTTEPSTADPYEAVLADLRAQRDQIDQAIQALERIRAMKAGGSLPISPAPANGLAPEQNAGIGPGAFFGMTIPEATKKLLMVRKKNLPNAEIIQGLEAGGLIMQSADKMNTINSVLMRRFQQVGDIVRVSRGVWGLREWHPNIRFKPKGSGDDAPPEREEEGPFA